LASLENLLNILAMIYPMGRKINTTLAIIATALLTYGFTKGTIQAWWNSISSKYDISIHSPITISEEIPKQEKRVVAEEPENSAKTLVKDLQKAKNEIKESITKYLEKERKFLLGTFYNGKINGLKTLGEGENLFANFSNLPSQHQKSLSGILLSSEAYLIKVKERIEKSLESAMESGLISQFMTKGLTQKGAEGFVKARGKDLRLILIEINDALEMVQSWRDKYNIR
jgi:hypothetical protein